MVPIALASLYKTTVVLVQRFGVLGACTHVVEVVRTNWPKWQARREFQAKQAAFDKRWGVQTSVWIPPDELKVIGPHRAAAVPYQPIGEESFQSMMAVLVELLGSDLPLYSFVDLGCGMGKAMLLAASQPFRQIVGVEFAPHLAAVCEKNLRADRMAAKRRCPSISVVVADATQFSFPDGPLAVFLYNPFGPQVLVPVLGNLRRRIASKPDPVFVSYLNAQHARLVEEAGFVQVWKRDEDCIFRFASEA